MAYFLNSFSPSNHCAIRLVLFLAVAVCLASPAGAENPLAKGSSVSDYDSIQDAIDKNPGKMMYVPPGKHEISKAILITSDNTGLFGFGEIVQNNPDEKIIEIRDVSGVQLKDITLRRPEGKMETLVQGVRALRCDNLVMDGVQIMDNRTRRHAILLEYCRNSQIRNCLVQNYMRIALDDRTYTQDHGYAFNVIHGTGISSRSSQGIRIEGNRIIELNLVPTLETKKKYKLGDFVKMLPEKGRLVSQKMWDQKYGNHWQQGSAIECRFASGIPKDNESDYTQILGNYIQNAAQGIDIHGDYVIVANNVVNDCFMGAKTMHGSKDVIITGNQFSKVALWGIYVGPGAFSTEAREAAGDEPAVKANVQAGTIIANNIISDVGYGNTAWAWKDDEISGGPQGIRLDKPQKEGLYPVTDVVIQGNVVYDPGRDGVLTKEGKVQIEPPHYNNAVFITTEPGGPQNVRFKNNIFHPGSAGVSNIDITP